MQPEQAAPPKKKRRIWLIAAILFGASLGFGTFTFDYAKGTSYLSSKSETCANCHVMQDHYDAWVKSTHGKFAKCNDCHAPHDFVGKWYCKGRNGFFHSLAFTTGDFHEPIQINEYNTKVVEDNCRYCHKDVVHAIDLKVDEKSMKCTRCHKGVGHPL